MAGGASVGAMRPSLLLAFAILVACAAPTAQAARAQVVLTTPSGAVQADAVVPVELTLVLSGFMCPEPYAFHVALTATASPGVNASWEQERIAFEVPAETYFADSYQATRVVNLTVRASEPGAAEITAALEPETGPCFVPNGFDDASTTISLRVDAPGSGAIANETAPETNATEPDANLTTTPTNETDANATNASTETPESPATPSAPGGPSCPPEGSCGLIGEYETGDVEESASPVPATALPLAAAVLAIAALVARKRRKP